MSLPYFPYHPDPIATGMVKPSHVICPCCESPTEFVYAKRPYCKERIENLCPQCISTGAAAKKFDALFSDDHPLVSAGLKVDIIDEVVLRTPGYISWQQDSWLTCCDDACEFHGDIKKEELFNLPQAVIDQFKTEHKVSEKNWASLSVIYRPGGNPSIFKFVCRHCRTVRLSFDFT